MKKSRRPASPSIVEQVMTGVRCACGAIRVAAAWTAARSAA
ncbi:MAG: hypothetical protein ACYS0D_13105 [Planctomycetota bacterium]